MNRRCTALLFLPVLFLMFMTAKALSHNRTKESAETSASPADVQHPSSLSTLTPEQNKWAESSLHQMTIEEKVGQLLFTTYHGSFTATDSETYAQLMHDINDLHVGGFITITHGSP